MTIRFDKVTIRVSELQTHTVVVGPWETPILQAMYGEECSVTGNENVKRPPPEAADEFARLAQRYGPKNSDMPIVAAVYGRYGPGVNALQSAINKAAGVPDAVVAAPVTPPEVEPVLSDAEVDAIVAAGDDKQTEIIENKEPQPPVLTSPAIAPESGEGAGSEVSGEGEGSDNELDDLT